MKRNIKKALLFGSISLSLLFSGCSKKEKEIVKTDFNSLRIEQDRNNITKSDINAVISTNYDTSLDLKGDDIVEIPEDYLSYVKCATNMDKESFSVNDLSKILTLKMYVTDQDLTWVNYCTNLKSINLSYLTNTDVTKYIDVLPSLSTCTIVSASNNLIEIDEEKFKFLKGANSLNISNNVCLDEDYLSTTSIKELAVISGIESKIDYKKLTFLDTLKIDTEDSYPYNSAIYFTSDDMNYLNENGVSIEVGEEVLKINKELDEINESLGIDSLESDISKYEKISTYVLNRLKYGDAEKAKFYYNKGFLYASLNGDEGVCGNYAGLVEALCLRNNITSYIIDSGSKGRHTWNLVDIDGIYYYSDITFLDGMINKDTLSSDDISNYIDNNGYYPFLFNENYTTSSIYDEVYLPKEYRKHMEKTRVITKEPLYKNSDN